MLDEILIILPDSLFNISTDAYLLTRKVPIKFVSNTFLKEDAFFSFISVDNSIAALFTTTSIWLNFFIIVDIILITSSSTLTSAFTTSASTL